MSKKLTQRQLRKLLEKVGQEIIRESYYDDKKYRQAVMPLIHNNIDDIILYAQNLKKELASTDAPAGPIGSFLSRLGMIGIRIEKL